jgi:GxxExxY protein
MNINQVSGAVVDAAMKVHSALGLGLLESAYEGCLVHELRQRGHLVKVQEVLPVLYHGVRIDNSAESRSAYSSTSTLFTSKTASSGW